jgi:hypothetical protein
MGRTEFRKQANEAAGAEARPAYRGVFGMTEVMPCYKAPWSKYST